MNDEKYKKAMKKHSDKIGDYADELHDFIDEVHRDNVSWNDIIGMLEVEKMFRFNQAMEYSKRQSIEEMLDGLADLLCEEE